MKRILSLILALATVLSLAAIAPSAHAYTGGKLVAITFDDGPGPYTNRLLDGLKARGAKATFFMLGQLAAKYPDTVKRVYNEGHQIANHSYDHSQLTKLSSSSIASQFSRTNANLEKATGSGAKIFIRAPYGDANSTVRSLGNAPFIYWSVDTLDWKYKNATTVKNNILRDTYDGAIILLHDIHSTSVDGALAAIDALQAQGYEFVTVSELFRRRGQTPQNGTTYYSVKPNGTDLGPVTAPKFSSTSNGDKLTITLTAQKGATIYYSTSSSTLNQDSKKYTGPITVTPPCTIWATAAFNMNGSRSETVSQTFTKLPSTAPGLDISQDGILTLTNKTSGANVYYTLDGTKATTSSNLYKEPVVLPENVTTVVSACAGGSDYLTSANARGVYSAGGNFYRDVFPDRWYFNDMEKAVNAGLVNGVGNGIYYPDATLSRAELVTLLYRASKDTVTEEQRESMTLTDVKSGEYYADAVAWACANKIVNGYEDGTFRPTRNVSRQEMAKIFVSFIKSRGCAIDASTDIKTSFNDYNKIGTWALDDVTAAVSAKLMNGDDKGNFSPADGASRAQAIAVLLRVISYVEQAPVVPETPDEPEAPAEPLEPTTPSEKQDENPTETPTETIEETPVENPVETPADNTDSN